MGHDSPVEFRPTPFFILITYTMKIRSSLISGTVAVACGLASVSGDIAVPDSIAGSDSIEAETDSLEIDETIREESIKRLDDSDYERAAKELGVEVASIKAVVLIEAGNNLRGFHAPRVPIINFDLTMFRKAAQKRGINLAKFRRSHSVVFERPDKKRYGSYQEAQHARLASAMSIDSIAAIEGTFWGMFQIGGFNWKKCGAQSHLNFVERMSNSESDQLELFVNFIRNSNLDKYLRNKDWNHFARIYNGPSYLKRNYHNKLDAAYRRFSKEAKAKATS